MFNPNAAKKNLLPAFEMEFKLTYLLVLLYYQGATVGNSKLIYFTIVRVPALAVEQWFQKGLKLDCTVSFYLTTARSIQHRAWN